MLKPGNFKLKVILRFQIQDGTIDGASWQSRTARSRHRRRTRHRPRRCGRADRAPARTVTVIGRSEAPLRDAVAAGRRRRLRGRRRHRRGAVERGDQGGRRGARRRRHPGRQCRRGRERRRSCKTDAAQFRRMFELNVMGVGACERARCSPAWSTRGFGRIVAIASTAGPEGLRLRHRLLRREARGGRPGARAGARDREDRRHRECGLPRLHRHRPGARQRRPRSPRRPAARANEALARMLEGRADRPPDHGREEVAAAVLYLCSPDAARRHRHDARRRRRGDRDGRPRPLPLDAETKVAERPDDHKAELRLWLRLLTCTDADRRRGAPAPARRSSTSRCRAST